MPNQSYQGKLGLYPYDPRYKAIAPPTVGIFDEPQMSICFNVEWAGHIDGVLSRLLWTDAWSGTPETQQWAVGQITALLISMMQRNPCGDGCMDDCCGDLTERLDALILAVRAGPKPTKKETKESMDAVSTAYETRIDEIEAVYMDDITNVHPDMAYGGDDDPIRDQALCFICQRFVDICCDWIVTNINLKVANQQTVLNIASFIGSASDLLGRVFAETAFGEMFENIDLVLDLEVQAATAWITSVTEDQLSIYQDTEARNAVACGWYNGLKGETPTLSRFLSTLYAASLTGNADTIRLKLGAALTPVDEPQQPNGEKLYFIWSDLWQEAYDGAQAGIVPDCLCEEEPDPLCRRYDAAHDLHTAFEIVNETIGDQAAWSGTGWGNASIPSRITIRYIGGVARDIVSIRVILSDPIMDGDTNSVALYVYPGYSFIGSEFADGDETIAINQALNQWVIDVVSDSSTAPGATPITAEITVVEVIFASDVPTDGTNCA